MNADSERVTARIVRTADGETRKEYRIGKNGRRSVGGLPADLEGGH